MVEPSPTRGLKVGVLARLTDLSVRTLHHYDEIGLLRPSGRTVAGHRLYSRNDVERLQRIASLRQLGLSLDEVRSVLDGASGAPLAILERQLAALDQQIGAATQLRARIAALADRLRAGVEVSTSEFLKTIKEMTMFEKHFTQEQLAQLAARKQQVGEQHLREVENEWPTLIAAMRAEMDKGSDPNSAAVQALAQRWRALVAEFTGGDPGLARSLSSLYHNEPSVRERTGIDPALMDYVRRAHGSTC